MITFRIRGQLVEAESGIGLTGLLVKAYDKDLLFDDLMGSAVSGEAGRLEIVSEAEDFRDFFERRPDIYLRVYTPDGDRQIFDTLGAVRWQAGRLEEFIVRIPRERLGELAPGRGVRLLDEAGAPREDFDPGESLTVEVEGLSPATLHEAIIRDGDGQELFRSSLMSDRNGRIDPTVLWPQMGLEDPETGEALTVEEGQERWRGRELTLEIRAGDRAVARTPVRLATHFTRPLLLATDREGRMVNGFVAGEAEAVVSAHNLPFTGQARVFLVPRQRDWHPGNPIRSVELAGGRPAWADGEVEDTGRLRLTLAEAAELAPGAYDFVVRRLRYGYEDDEELVLRPDDVVTRTVTGLVVREDFMASKAVLGGCVNHLQIAGRRLSGAPYFQFTDTFQEGEEVWGALDPAALDPTLLGKMTALHVVVNKTSTQWSADKSLNHLPALGGNPSVLKFKTQAGCINFNKRLLWASAQGGFYDVVADFGNNTSNPATFAPDHQLTSPTDIIDGYFNVGFRVIKDPTTDTGYPHAGTFQYTEATEGSVTVQDELSFYEPPASPTLGSDTVPRRAVVYFPADSAGATTPAQISAVKSSYPLVVVLHGNSSYATSYLGYNYLLEHLAKNGFIAASVHLDGGMGAIGRARVLFDHVDRLKTKFGSKLANNIGIMGHSRGGEAVVKAAKLNHDDSLGHNVNAIISLAPTDHYGRPTLQGAWATPYLVVYGSMDGDVAGSSTGTLPQRTGFSLYDRASGAAKSLVFVYGAIHGHFNTVWGDGDLYFGKIGPSDLPKVISAAAHQTIAKGYMTAFFRRHLLGEAQFDGALAGEWIPTAVEQADAGTVKVYIQHEGTNRREVDNFEGTHTATSWQSSTVGGSVDHGSTLPADPQENALSTLDSHSPHDSAGLALRWDHSTDRLTFTLPAGAQNVSSYGAVAVRIAQKVGSTANPVGQAQDLYLTLKDTTGKARAIKVGKFAEVPPPHERAFSQYTKSALATIRIPLHVYTIEVLGTDRVDLTQVESLTLDFKAKASGEIEIDSVEFTA